MLKLKNIVLILAVVSVICTLSFVPVFAADAKASAQQVIGTVDLEKVFDSYNKTIQSKSLLAAKEKQIVDWLENRDRNKLLTDAEFKQMMDFKNKQNPSDDDKKKIEELQTLSIARDKEMASLQQKQTPTDQEKARLEELQKQASQVTTMLNEELKKGRADVQKQAADMNKEIMTSIDAAVAVVAKEKGFTIVFNKAAGGATFIAFSNADITDDIIKKLNK